ncbi:uncharacterized protein LOC100889177 [Strongylocentrotus purpuratus]|uniref:Uncharacterized protein n=1 Tax=Strongylocentrotus purpuratus TaxID=7668 RepID=A0A7M7LPD5_STRPU|nr:uncharacterized protein LOC100889177 [Strongylocentrotus purpuratus]|eukprot:XP_003726725.1 PREDICTED: uncharacterized protein LOC100889177 [Strongylocentrotus purpuratus]
MLLKIVMGCLPVLLVIMAATSTTAASGPNSQFHRDRRAIRARTMATGEDHIAHASIKMRMMNEGRSRLAVNHVRAKRFINAASGAQQTKVSDAIKEYAGNQYEPVFSGKGRASELVDEIQHGYVQPPRAPFSKDAVYEDLLTRQRKDGQQRMQPGHRSREPENLSQMRDEVDEFLQLMHELGILGNRENEIIKGSKKQGNTKEVARPSSAAAFISHHINRPKQNDDIAMKAPTSGFGGNTDSHRSSAVVHTLPRSPGRDARAFKRESSPYLFKETLDNEDGDEEVVAVKEEAIIDIPPQALANFDSQGLGGIDLEIIKKLLEKIIARKSPKSENI